MKYDAFDNKKMFNFFIAFVGMFISGLIIFIILERYGKRKRKIINNRYYQYLLTLSPQELEIEKIKILQRQQQQQNETMQLLMLSLFL